MLTVLLFRDVLFIIFLDVAVFFNFVYKCVTNMANLTETGFDYRQYVYCRVCVFERQLLKLTVFF